jgi:type VI secretion system protein ImpM
MKTVPTVGFYGKLPCKGDFVHRRVPQQFVEVWDGWICELLIESRLRLQDRWRETYLTSPAWRFVLAQGLCGSGMYAGVMLPSIDRVGRCFPLALVARWDMEDLEPRTACNQQRWFESATALALDALTAPNLSVEDFDQSVAESAAHIIAGDDRSACASTMTMRELQSKSSPLSFWWTGGVDRLSSNMLCVRGLPDTGGFATTWLQRRTQLE